MVGSQVGTTASVLHLLSCVAHHRCVIGAWAVPGSDLLPNLDPITEGFLDFLTAFQANADSRSPTSASRSSSTSFF
jgi:hypothetical protein